MNGSPDLSWAELLAACVAGPFLVYSLAWRVAPERVDAAVGWVWRWLKRG